MTDKGKIGTKIFIISLWEAPQNSIMLNTCICKSEGSYNFTEQIREYFFLVLTHNLHMFLDTMTIRYIIKMKDWTKLNVKMWSQIVEEVAVFGI